MRGRAETPLPEGVRVRDFRTFGGQIQKLGPNGWQTYVPFGELLKEHLPGKKAPGPPAVSKEEEPPMEETPLRFSERLARIAQRQTEVRAAIAQPVEAPMQMEVTNGKNGVRGKRPRRSYTPEFKAEVLSRYEQAEDKRNFAKAEGINIANLCRWKAEANAGQTGPAPVKPAKTRSARSAAEPDHELEVLRQLLNLPAQARERIVAYLTARGR